MFGNPRNNTMVSSPGFSELVSENAINPERPKGTDEEKPNQGCLPVKYQEWGKPERQLLDNHSTPAEHHRKPTPPPPPPPRPIHTLWVKG